MKYFILALLLLTGYTKPVIASTEDEEILRLLTSPNAIVYIARGELGKGEIGGDNKGRYVKEYTRGKEVAWCSGFVSWVVNRAGKNGNYLLQARSWLKAQGSKRVTFPSPGDLIIFDRGNGKGHVGIIEMVSAGRIVSIEGNVGNYPSKVKRVIYKLSHIKNLIGFVRLT